MEKIEVFALGKGNGHKKVKRTDEARAVLRNIEENPKTASIHSKSGCKKCWGHGYLEWSHPMGKVQNKDGKIEPVVVLTHKLCSCVEKKIDRMMSGL